MHPQLHEHKHESCTDIIMQLNECHSSVFRSYFLQCNGLKKRLNVCLAAEVGMGQRGEADLTLLIPWGIARRGAPSERGQGQGAAEAGGGQVEGDQGEQLRCPSINTNKRAKCIDIPPTGVGDTRTKRGGGRASARRKHIGRKRQATTIKAK
jgi:COX assembly protein 2